MISKNHLKIKDVSFISALRKPSDDVERNSRLK